jgi:hypothetical protein
MDVTMGVILLLVTGFLWVAGAILHWHNIRRQEKLLARMQRMSVRRAPRAVHEEWEETAEPELVGEGLRPAKHWTVE